MTAPTPLRPAVTVNDGYPDASADNPAARAYERLLRKLLAQKNAPAVVLVHFFSTDIKKNSLPFYHTCERGSFAPARALARMRPTSFRCACR